MDDVRVLQLTRYDRLGGSSRLRFYDYHPLLAQHGIAITAAPFFDDTYLHGLYARRKPSASHILSYYKQRLAALLSKNRYDLIWLEKEALPWLPAMIELPLLGNMPFVIDFDDAWFHRYDQHANPAVRRLLHDKFPSLVRKSTAVLAGSPYLAEWAEKQGARKVVRLPTTVDLPRYRVKPPVTYTDFTIGWLGSPSTASYLHLIDEALLAEQKKGATIRLVGSGPVDLKADYQLASWSEGREADELAQFDVGIMPLTPDPWSEGKCAYKLIQYMAAGLPVVASPVGMNRDVVQHGVNGFLAGSTNEWIAALETLRGDPALRLRMGAAGRKSVEETYSLAGNAGLLARILREAALGGNQGL